MNEIKHITTLFSDIYDGDPWIDVTLTGTLEKISPESAAKRIIPHCNTVWEIVNHIISWRENVLQRVQGKVMITPDNNYFTAIADQSSIAWEKTLQALKNSQLQWIAFLEKLKEEDLEKIYPGNDSAYYKHIYGIIQHDAYHLGQIILLIKLM